MVGTGVHTECREGGEDDEDDGPAMVQREGQMYEELVGGARWLVILLDDVVDVRHGGANEERENESCAEANTG